MVNTTEPEAPIYAEASCSALHGALAKVEHDAAQQEQFIEASQSFSATAIAEAWRTGSVVRSWLLDLIARGLAEDPELAGIKGWVEDTGEGRWTVEAAIDEAVPVPIIAESLFARFRSRMENTFGDRMLAMMRNQFGGHAVIKDAGGESAKG